MANTYTMEDLLDFLTHAGKRGLMPAATATALGVAVRNVFGVLKENEQNDLSRVDVDAVFKRFTNKRKRDFSPGSLKEYDRRVRRALDLYVKWRDDPANFSVKTRATSAAGTKQRNEGVGVRPTDTSEPHVRGQASPPQGPGYTSSIPIRTDWVVTLTNIPPDLTRPEADRLATFVRMLAVK